MQSTSKFDELSLNYVKKEVHRDINEEITATHFVSGIEYGTQAVFVFDRDVDEKERNFEAENDLAWNSLSTPRLAEVPLFRDEMDAEELRKVKSSFYGNQTIASFKSPMSYRDAAMAYSALQTNEDP